MFKVEIADIEKTEQLKELANEFLPPEEYELIPKSNYLKDCHINEAKKDLFLKLKDITGESPEWGILTGVRPVKLAGEFIEKIGREETKRVLLDEYYLSEKKADSIIDIYEYQIDILGKAPNNSVSLYIGIPFCPTRCLYCSFASNQVPEGEIERYLPALTKEIKEVSNLVRDKGFQIESIYIGGGTPTTLNSSQLQTLMGEIENSFDLSNLKEYTVEAGRPDTITDDKLRVIKDYGGERISINPQTMTDKTLELIGRFHTVKDTERAFKIANKVGFKSINSDLIAGLPQENLADMENSLNRILEFGANNITVHSLAVKRASRLKEEDPNYHYKYGNLVKEMIRYSEEYLRGHGFVPYYLYRQKHMSGAGENTGYTIPGYEGLYNVRIMDEHQTILALGAGGISKQYFPEENRLERIANVTNYEQYIDRIDEMIGRKINAYKCTKGN